jgi:CheY-like chemotaxis protein
MSITINKSQPVLILAEDDYANAQFVKIVFSRENVCVLHAENGKDAVDLFVRNPGVNLILMDVKMPLMDGYTATREIRKLNREVPIVAITAFTLDNDRTRALEAGCNEYFTKPVSIDQLKMIKNSYIINQ